jgi:hypothetical protein
MADSPAVTLPCKQCGYVNEPERVYCHNCGSKLDRSILPREENLTRETPDKARKRIQKMTNPQTDHIKREIVTFVKTMFWAATAALLIQLVRAPDNVPTVSKEALPRMISSDMMDATESPQPHLLTFTDDEINTYLKSAVKDAKDPSWTAALVEYKRTFITTTPGVIHIGMERSLFGLPLFVGTDYKLEVINNVFTPTNVGGNFGRVPIHPLLMKYFGAIYDGLWSALHRERQLMEQVSSVRIDKGKITLVTRGAKK